MYRAMLFVALVAIAAASAQAPQHQTAASVAEDIQPLNDLGMGLPSLSNGRIAPLVNIPHASPAGHAAAHIAFPSHSDSVTSHSAPSQGQAQTQAESTSSFTQSLNYNFGSASGGVTLDDIQRDQLSIQILDEDTRQARARLANIEDWLLKADRSYSALDKNIKETSKNRDEIAAEVEDLKKKKRSFATSVHQLELQAELKNAEFHLINIMNGENKSSRNKEEILRDVKKLKSRIAKYSKAIRGIEVVDDIEEVIRPILQTYLDPRERGNKKLVKTIKNVDRIQKKLRKASKSLLESSEAAFASLA